MSQSRSKREIPADHRDYGGFALALAREAAERLPDHVVDRVLEKQSDQVRRPSSGAGAVRTGQMPEEFPWSPEGGTDALKRRAESLQRELDRRTHQLALETKRNDRVFWFTVALWVAAIAARLMGF